MILLPERGLAFLHVPKTGGTAITEALLPWIAGDARADGLYELHEGGRDFVHEPAVTALQRLPEGVRTFAVVRDPCDRLVSMWRHENTRGLDLEAWAQELPQRQAQNPFYLSQWDLLAAGEGIAVDDLLRYEYLAAEWRAYSKQKLGRAVELPVRKLPSKERPAVRRERLVELVTQVWPEDVWLLDGKRPWAA